MTLLAAPAGAFTGRQFIGRFPVGSKPEGIAVGQASGDLYVADTAKNVVDEVDPSGNPVAQLTGSTTPSGSFSFVHCSSCVSLGAVAVDNSGGASDGDLYVVDSGHNVIDRFSAGGSYLGQLTASGAVGCGPAGTACSTPFSGLAGVATDPSGNLWVDDGAGDVFEFDPAGNELASWNAGFPMGGGLAVDSSDNVYVIDVATHTVEKFDAAGVSLGAIDNNYGDGAVAVAPGADHLIVADYSYWVYEYDSTGTLLFTTKPPPPYEYSVPEGVAVDGASGDLYLADPGDPAVVRWGPVVTLPDVSAGPASPVTPTSETLTGTVNPSGQAVTDCHFDYGTTTGYGQSVPCAQSPASIGSGTSAVPVSADVTGLTPDTTYHFRLVASDAQGTNPSADQTFTTTGSPSDCAIPKATSITPTSAQLGAQVNPNGFDTTYHFEYGTTTGYGTSVPVPDADIGSGTTCVSASVPVTGLQAGSTYHFRVVATNSQGTFDSPDYTFVTPPPAQIDSVSVSALTSGTATLNAQINPGGTDTTYHFEWGTSTSYGHSIPVPDGDLGSGTSDVSVSQAISGLTANTTYHYRVVVTNSLAPGGFAGPDHTFNYDTQTPATLPDGRAYEQVTPVHKNAALVEESVYALPVDIAASGSRIMFMSLQCFASASSCTATRVGQGEPYSASRASTGWTTTAFAPPAQLGENSLLQYSADADTTLFSIGASPTSQDDWYARQPDGSFSDVGPLTPPAKGPRGAPPFPTNNLYTTADLSHLVWGASIPDTWPFDPSAYDSVYEYTGTGNSQPAMVPVTGGPGSTALIGDCGSDLGQEPGTLSADGRTVFFSVSGTDSSACWFTKSPPTAEIGARIDGTLPDAHTVILSQRSPSDCTTTACTTSPAADAHFWGASSDGSKAFFTSTQQLTDNASEDDAPGDSARGSGCGQTTGPNGCNLYLYDFGNPSGHELVDVSAGDASGSGPRVQGVAGFSSDGTHVYFIAKGVLTATANSAGQTAQDGAENLYAYERDAAYPTGHTAFIATLSGADAQTLVGRPTANVTPDGRYLVFASHSALTPDAAAANGTAQVYRYDAQTGGLIRISIGNNGFNDNGNASGGDATIVPAADGTQRAGTARLDPTMSDDGSYVFFQSPAGLTPQALNNVVIDSNGDLAQNVYEWHDGHVYLISDGTDTNASVTYCSITGRFGYSGSSVCLLGTDTTGSNVFFTTADQLVPQDTDTQVDIYDARIGGGFPYTPPVSCSGDGCHGTPSSPPTVPTAGTVTFSGAGNASSTPVHGRVRVLRRGVRGARGFFVRVRVPGAGDLTINGAGIRRDRKQVARAGSYRLRVWLTAAQKRRLRHRHRLRLKLRVAYRPAQGFASHVTFSITDRA